MLNLLSIANNEYTYVISSAVTAFLKKKYTVNTNYTVWASEGWIFKLVKTVSLTELIWAFLGIIYFFTTYTVISLRDLFIPATIMTV